MENRKTLTLGSLFSGSGGFELGAVLAGIRPIWNSDIAVSVTPIMNIAVSTCIHTGM